MQDYCGTEVKTDVTFEMGIRRMRDLIETEGERTYASNPHELARLLEDFGLADLGILVMQASLARKSSCGPLNFRRYDIPEQKPEWDCLVAVSQQGGEVKVRKVSKRYYLEAPYAPTLEENYQRYAALD